MKRNPVKEKLKSGQLTLGGWITIPHPAVAEVMALTGLEFLVIDTEHGAINIESVQMLIQAMAGTEVVPIVRVAAGQRAFMNKILDTGPGGVIVPMVNSRQEAEEAVRSALYPPQGVRGIGLGRAQGYDDARRSEYLKVANDLILVMVQVEHVEAVKHIEEIVTTPGLDAVFVGPADLSGSMGLTGQADHPEVQKAIEKVVEAAARVHLPLGIPVGGPDNVAHRVRQGFQLLHVAVDSMCLGQACAHNLRSARVAAAQALSAVPRL